MTKDELDKYLAHLPVRQTRKGGPSSVSSNTKRLAQLDRPLPGLKGPRGLAFKSKTIVDRPQQSPPTSLTNSTERNNQDESVVDLTNKMDLNLTMDSPPLSEKPLSQKSHSTNNDIFIPQDISYKEKDIYYPTEPDITFEQTSQSDSDNDNNRVRDDISPPKLSKSNRPTTNQQPEEMPPIPTFSFGNDPTATTHQEQPEEMPPIPTFSFGADSSMPPIPTFSFGNDDNSCNNNEEHDILNLAVGLRCGICDKMISGMVITAAGQRWHADCFKCQHCHQDLEHVAFYEKDGLPYCALDYHELFTTRCHYCHTPIEEKSVHALGKYYHVGHLFCRECGKPFDEDSMFMEHDGHPYCEKDYLAKFAQKCKGCKEDISGNFLEALEGKWHLTCFVCVDCGKAFESNTFYVRNNLPYCEQHSRRIKRSV